ncbi:MAG: Ig-like domain-containing protein, partial [Clostridiales bacterium]|nr:Ig-like domain-containing protein [Clostridiales bacterium]
YAMTLTPATGVYSVTVTGDLANRYYMYKVTQLNGTTAYAVDPYATALSANGQLTAIVDMDASEGVGADVPKLQYPDTYSKTDSILYEMHVRDFSISLSSGVVKENMGKFAGISTGTTVPDTGIKTGIDHLVELGITTVHLLPVFDFASVNELDPNLTDMDVTSLSGNSYPKTYNWGYDPQNYNVPEGSYSTDPKDPTARIKEFKTLVKALHDKGIRVVMDVVYNHTYSVDDGPFNKIVPTYFYRTNAEGYFVDASGCGNEVATEKAMVRKYIIDSVLYWQKEYGIDGFRFDLMTIIDGDTMAGLVKALQVNDPNVLVYGEPWAAGSVALDSDKQIRTDNFKSLWSGKDFAIFNEKIRKAIKGESDNQTKGFATENTSYKGDILGGVYGGDNLVGRASENINYVTAHDNLNLWDKIRYSYTEGKSLHDFAESMSDPYKDLVLAPSELKIKGNSPFKTPDKSYFLGTGNGNASLQSSVLSTGMLLTMQGIPFFQAGDEFLRSKKGDHNSYSSNDGINAIDWTIKDTYKDVFDYVAGLVALRKAHPAFRMDEYPDIKSKITDLSGSGNVVAFKIGPYANNDSWKYIYVAYNGSSTATDVNFGTSGLHVVVNNEHAGTEAFGTPTGTWNYLVPPRSMVVLYDGETPQVLDHVLISPRTATRVDDVSSNENVSASSPVDASPIELLVGETQQLNATLFNADYNVIANSSVAVKWSSSDNDIATVGANGLVTSVGAGTAIITATATAASGAIVKKATVNISVNKELTVKFKHSPINWQQLTVLSVTGSNKIKEVKADLSKLGGGASVNAYSHVPGQFQLTVNAPKTLEADSYDVPVTVTMDNNTTETATAKLDVKAYEEAENDFDWDEARIYFLLTDRFALANSAGDMLSSRIVKENSGYAQVFANQSDYTRYGAYHGGNLDGVTSKVDYLKDLGVNTVWVTPLVDNIEFNVGGDANTSYGYAGYWAKTFEAIDEHLGDLSALSKALDNNGMKLMVDVVINHAGYGMDGFVAGNWSAFGGNNSLFPKIAEIGKFILPNGLSMFRSSSEDSRIKTGLVGLPDFRTEDWLVRDLLAKWQAGWIEKYGIDYFRVDTVKHVDNDTWRALKKAVVSVDPNFKMIGEMYAAQWDRLGDSENDGVYSEDYLAVDQLDSLLDFDFKNIALGFATWNSPDTISAKNDNGTQIKVQGTSGTVDISSTVAALKDRETFFDIHQNLTLGQFLSSHDEDSFATRFISDASAELKYSELMNAASLQITSRGQPVIYYGEEIAQFGKYSNNSDSKQDENRYDFDWLLAEKNPLMLQHYKALLNSRDDYSKAFSQGARTYNSAYGTDYDDSNSTNGQAVLSFVATYDNDPLQSVLVAINRADKDQKISFNSTIFPASSALVDIYAKHRRTYDETYSYGKVTITAGTAGSVTDLIVPSRKEGGIAIYVLDPNLSLTGPKYAKVGDTLEFTASGSVVNAKSALTWSLVTADESENAITAEAEIDKTASDYGTLKLKALSSGKVRVKVAT